MEATEWKIVNGEVKTIWKNATAYLFISSVPELRAGTEEMN
jgi:hypothetical protein